MSLSSQRPMLPAVHASWLAHLLTEPPPEETEATCDRCVMCHPKDATVRSEIAYFDDSSKCCTYQPQLANFLVGAMLEDDSAEFAAGRASIERRIDEREGVTPLGLQRTW